MLCEAIGSLKNSDRKDAFVQSLLQQLASSGLAKTPEGVAIWLTASAACGTSILPDGVWKQNDPMSTKERQNLVKILKGSDVDETGEHDGDQKSQTGYAMPLASFAWDVVLNSAIAKSQPGENSIVPSTDFSKFWLDVIDGKLVPSRSFMKTDTRLDNLFAASSSHQRKGWGFQLFAKMISTAPAWALPSIFSPNLVRSLINQRKGSDRYLHQATLAPLKEMQSRVTREPQTAATFVTELTRNNGVIDFDHITKTKTLESIMEATDDDTMARILSSFKNLVSKPDSQDPQEAHRERRLIADMLVAVSKGRAKGELDASSAIDLNSWLYKLFELFVEIAYFTPDKSVLGDAAPSPDVTESTREVFRTRLVSCLTNFATAKADDEGLFPYTVVKIVRLLSQSEKFQLLLSANSEVTKEIEQAHRTQEELVLSLKKAKESKKPTLRALNLLWSHTFIQVYNGDADAILILEDLRSVQESVTSRSKDKAQSEEGFDLLLEVLLSFMAKPSALTRKLAEDVFSAFTAHMTFESLQSLIDILEKKEGVKGQEELFKGENEDADDESLDAEDASDVEMVDDDEAESIDSDVEEIQEDNGDESEGEENSAEEDEGDDDGDDEEVEDDAEVLQFEAKLAEALGTSKLPPGDSEGEESDSDMDDEQMMELDGHIARIFRERKGKDKSQKQERKDAKETVLNFKNRVLDLLLIYVKQQYANHLALDLIFPLLRLIRTTTSKQVGEKAFDLLKRYFDASKGKDKEQLSLDGNSEELEGIWGVLTNIHEEVSRSDSKMFNTACTRASLFLARIVMASSTSPKSSSKAYRKLADLYADTQQKWYEDSQSNIQLSFFQEWLNWSNDMRKQHRGASDKAAASSTTPQQITMAENNNHNKMGAKKKKKGKRNGKAK